MRSPSRHLAALLLALATSAACATRPGAIATPPGISSTTAIDALIARGCFDCLRQAYDAAVAASNQNRTFETAVLLTARAKELGLPYAPWLERARAALPAGPDWSDYLAIVQALRIDPLADDRDAVLAETLKTSRLGGNGRRVARRSGNRCRLPAAPRLPRAFAGLSIHCARIVTSPSRRPCSGFLAYRSSNIEPATCGLSQAPHLPAVREAVPEFADVDFLLGRYALDIPRQPDQEEALRRFTAARSAFPESPAIVASLAALRRDREEWMEALEAYDASLMLVPTHRDALLGRAVTLSHLARHDDAIAAATRILELGSWFTGEAYYWRAWNEYHVARIDDARIDTDRAKGLMHNASVLVLSGMIEWHEHRLDESEAELQDALTLDAGQCEAAFLLGAVRAERRQWASGAAAFELAQRCYDLSVTLRRETIARITAGPGTSEGKARQIAQQQRAMSEEAQHRDEAAQNAANLQKRGGV